MNKERRKRLQKVIDKLEELGEELHDICSEEEDAYDNMPEGLQQADRGQQMYENIDEISDMECELNDWISRLQDIVDA